MGRVSGYQCDRCEIMEVSEEFPHNWIRVQISVNGSVHNTTFELCGNECLATLAVERCKEIDGLNIDLVKRRAKASSKAVKDAVEAGKETANSRGGRSAWMSHLSNHRQKNTVDPDCFFCDRETQGVNDDDPEVENVG